METLEPTPPPRRRSRTLLGIGIGLVIVALIGLGVLLIPRLLGTTVGAVNVTAAAMPAETQVYFSFNPHFDQLPNGDVVRKAWGNGEFAELIEGSIRDTLADNDLDWDQDIVPWLGDEIGIGLWNLPLDFTASDAPPPSVALAIETRDVTMSNALLAKLLRAQAESTGSRFTEQTYRDVVTVEQTDPGSGEPVAYAQIEDLAIVATGSDDLHAAIDALLDKNGLDVTSHYQTATGQLRGGRAVTAYMNLGPIFKALIDSLQESSEAPPTELNQQALDTLEALQGAAMGLSFEPNGLRLEVVATVDVEQLPAGQQASLTAPPSSSRLLRAVPDSTFFYAGGTIPPNALDVLLGDPSFVEAAKALEQQFGIDLQEDVLSWLNGEIAVVAMPGSALGGGPFPFPFSLALIVNVADKQLAETSAHRLIEALAAESGSAIEEVTIGDVGLRGILDTRSGEPVLVYGLIRDNWVLAFPESAAQKIISAGERPLADDETFKEAVAPLPKDNGGYLYVKPRPIVDLATLGLSAGGQRCVPCAFFEPVRAIAFAAEQPQAEAGVGRNLFFALVDTSEGE